MRKQISAARTAALIGKASPAKPRLAIVLGSGFAEVVRAVRVQRSLSYSRLPGFPRPGVAGHAGRLLVGTLGGAPVLVLCGRAHYYEGHEMEAVTFPIRVLAEYGIEALLLTNAAGGINRRFERGDLMLVTDHINLMGVNPLRDLSRTGSPQFVDLSRAYDSTLGRLLRRAADRSGVRLRSGVYLAVSGPSYETPAEIRAFLQLGADAVGMSTVPEVLVARMCGLQVAAVSCITNLAAGLGPSNLSHAEVLATAKRAGGTATELLLQFCRLYADIR